MWDIIKPLRENLYLLLEHTIPGSKMYTMREKINITELIQAQYHNLFFEQELFNILLKNKYAINTSANDFNNIEYDDGSGIIYANTMYPFSLIICANDADRSSILINNVGLVLVKFILYLRMLTKNVGRPDSTDCLLAVNMKLLPFGRICIDVDYKNPVLGDKSKNLNDEEYERFIEKCFGIVCEMTTTGNVIMTKNCFKPNTRSFHLITEQQFDVATRDVLFYKITERINEINSNVKIDQVHVWMLPFGRGHLPVRKYDRKQNEFVKLAFPYTEIDFELAMPFDQNLENLYTLLNYTEENVCQRNTGNYDVLHEYLNDDIVHSYYIHGMHNIVQNMQLYVKISSFKYDFAFQSLNNYRYEHNYLPQVLDNKYNNYFLNMSNKKLLSENNWQIPKPKIKQRPKEFYEIYRFVSHKLINGLGSMKELFSLMPQKLTRKNVNIGNDDEIMNETKKMSMSLLHQNCEIDEVYSGNMEFNLNFNETSDNDAIIERNIQTANNIHPWPYILENRHELFSIASVSTKHIYEFFRKTIDKNTYPYEKNDKSMIYFRNIQTLLSSDLKQFQSISKEICKVIINGYEHNIQKYMFPMYEFFCRIHYIDACITTEEYQQMQNGTLSDTLRLNVNENLFEQYRKKYVEMSPCQKAYRKFPVPNTPLDKIWHALTPENKVIIHIIYLLIVEHNYTSIFVYLHNLLKDTLLKNNLSEKNLLICSYLLNIIEDSYEDDSTGQYVRSYASKEFLNFVYKTFIDAGTNMRCDFKNGNIHFNMVHLQAIISDLQTMFISSPVWFFLANFQYMNENLDFATRFDLFLQIFQQEPQTKQQRKYGSGRGVNSGVRMNFGGGSGAHDQQPTPSERAKRMKSSVFMPDKYFKAYNINENYHGDLLSIFYKNILSLCKMENNMCEYIYDGARFCTPSLTIKYTRTPQIINERVKYAMIYRHQFGIYNSWTMQYERNTSALYTQITISNEEFAKYPELFNAFNEDIYKIMVNRYLKSITFTRVLNQQKNLALLLAPIYDPNIHTSSAYTKTLNYNIDSIQINIHDLSSPDYTIPDEMLHDLLETQNKLYDMFKWLYAIICHYSESFSCIITKPSSFIPKCMVQDSTNIESSCFPFQQQMTDNRYTVESDANKGENLVRRIRKVLNSKKSEQQQNITDELQQLSQQELKSLLILYESISNAESKEALDENELPSTSIDKSSADKDCSSGRSSSCEYINKFNLSTRGTNNSNDEYVENPKNKLLLNLFNRKLSQEISQMTLENFKKIIGDNFSTHIAKFVLLTLSWFIRTTHIHIFSESLFFREIHQHRQLLYNELCELTFKHNGYFMYNNSIVDVVEVFRYYCRNVRLVVDPIFEESFTVGDAMYLDYDAEMEERVLSHVIEDIESGCVSAIYQGQFIEDTNVDLIRLWARVTVPRNKHKISPLFNLHTATGNSEYLTERCHKHFNNKYHNNILDLNSLKTSNHRGIDMAKALNANLIVCIEDFSEKFKEISLLTYKPLWADTNSSFKNNATVILSTNNDPKCTEAAIKELLHVYPRHIQYANVNKYLKFQRATNSTATVLNTNNIFAVQLIMGKMPRVVAENYKGNFMMTWLLKRFFLYNIFDPVTVQASETLQNHIDNMINAPQLVLERLELNTGEMTLFHFRKLVNRICEENRHLFNSKINTNTVFTILSDNLKAMISNETQTIHVSEKVIK